MSLCKILSAKKTLKNEEDLTSTIKKYTEKCRHKQIVNEITHWWLFKSNQQSYLDEKMTCRNNQ